jgi:hypothetical protein
MQIASWRTLKGRSRSEEWFHQEQNSGQARPSAISACKPIPNITTQSLTTATSSSSSEQAVIQSLAMNRLSSSIKGTNCCSENLQHPSAENLQASDRIKKADQATAATQEMSCN